MSSYFQFAFSSESEEIRTSVGSVPRLACASSWIPSLQTIKRCFFPPSYRFTWKKIRGNREKTSSEICASWPAFFRPCTPRLQTPRVSVVWTISLLCRCAVLVTPLDCECINRWWNRIWNLEQRHLAGTVKITHFSFISIAQRWLHTDIKLALNEATYTSMTQDGAPVAGFSGTEHRSRDVVNDQNFWVKWSVWETIGGIFYSKASDWPFHSWQKANRRADPSVIRQVIRIRHQSLFRSDADAFSIKQVPVFFRYSSTRPVRQQKITRPEVRDWNVAKSQENGQSRH